MALRRKTRWGAPLSGLTSPTWRGVASQPAPAKAPAPAGAPPPPPMAPFQPPPSPPPPTAPRLPTSAANIANAASKLGTTTNDINRQLLDAAYRFGGQKNTDQYIFNPETQSFDIANQDVQTNENSQLAQIQRALDTGDKASSNSRLRAGTLRSGLRLQDVTDLSNTAERERAQALYDYQSAVSKIRGLLMGAFGEYQGTRASADAADLESWLSQPPVDVAPEPAPAAAPIMMGNGMTQAEFIAAWNAAERAKEAELNRKRRR